MADEASASQEAALGVLRLLDTHIRSIAFHYASPHAHSIAPLPPQFLPVVPPMAVVFNALACTSCRLPLGSMGSECAPAYDAHYMPNGLRCTHSD